MKSLPSFSSAEPSLKVVTRTSGPLVSSMIATFFPLSAIASRMFANTPASASWVPWDMLILATFIPASIIFRSISLVLLAGPMVHTIFVFLIVRFPPFFRVIHSNLSIHLFLHLFNNVFDFFTLFSGESTRENGSKAAELPFFFYFHRIAPICTDMIVYFYFIT